MAIIVAFAEAAELDNGDVESRNAVLRRRVKHCLQQKALELADLSMHWIFNDARSEAAWIGGVSLPVVPAADDGTEAPVKMKAGGGGLCRGFISEYKDEYLDEKGQVSFTMARDAYQAEVEKPSSEKLDAIRDKAKQAIQIYRDSFQRHGTHSKGSLSSFGNWRTAKPSVSQQSKREAELFLEDCQRGFNEMSTGITPADNQQIVQRYDVVQGVLCTRVSGDLEHQLQVLRRASRLDAIHNKTKQEAEDQELAALVCAPCNAGSIDFSVLKFSSGALRRLPGNTHNIVWTDNAVDSSILASTNMTKRHDKSTADVVEQFETVHSLITQESLKPIGEVSETVLPSACQREGHGMCICNNSENGLVTRLARRAFAAALCFLCPRKSMMRKLLSEGRIVVHIPGTAAWVHVALMYYKPRRPTLVMLVDRGESRWGYTQLRAQFGGAGELECATDCEFVATLPLVQPLNLELFRFLAFERLIASFIPGNYLLIGPIEREHLSNDYTNKFWPGSTEALEEERKREEKKRLDAARSAARKRKESGGKSRKRRQSKSTDKEKTVVKARRKDSGARDASGTRDSQQDAAPLENGGPENEQLQASDGESSGSSSAGDFSSMSSSDDEAKKDLNKAHMLDDRLHSSESEIEGDHSGGVKRYELLDSSGDESVSVGSDGPLTLDIEEHLANIMPNEGEALTPPHASGQPVNADSGGQKSTVAAGNDGHDGDVVSTEVLEDLEEDLDEQLESQTTPVASPCGGNAGQGPCSDEGSPKASAGEALGGGAGNSPTARSAPSLSPSYTPTTAHGSPGQRMGTPPDRPSESSSSDGDGPGNNAPAVSRSDTQCGARGSRIAERAAPRGCTMRRYDPGGAAPPYWLGTLPNDTVDSDGRHSRQRAFRPGLRTEAEAIDLVEQWLKETMDNLDQEDLSGI